MQKEKTTGSCESCAYYAYDEDYECYTCEMDLDEDELVRFLSDAYHRLPLLPERRRVPGGEKATLTREGKRKCNIWNQSMKLSYLSAPNAQLYRKIMRLFLPGI